MGREPSTVNCTVGLPAIQMPVAFVPLLWKRQQRVVECDKMDDVKRNRLNRNTMGGYRSHQEPPRGRGGEPERAMAKP